MSWKKAYSSFFIFSSDADSVLLPASKSDDREKGKAVMFQQGMCT